MLLEEESVCRVSFYVAFQCLFNTAGKAWIIQFFIPNPMLCDCRHAALALDARSPTATLDAAMAKRHATDACYDVTNHALQLLGGYGYLKEYPIERVMRDLRVHSILEVGFGCSVLCFFPTACLNTPLDVQGLD